MSYTIGDFVDYTVVHEQWQQKFYELGIIDRQYKKTVMNTSMFAKKMSIVW